MVEHSASMHKALGSSLNTTNNSSNKKPQQQEIATETTNKTCTKTSQIAHLKQSSRETLSPKTSSSSAPATASSTPSTSMPPCNRSPFIRCHFRSMSTCGLSRGKLSGIAASNAISSAAECCQGTGSVFSRVFPTALRCCSFMIQFH